MRGRGVILAGCLALGGCHKGDTLVVVTVSAAVAIEDVAVLHATAGAGGRSETHDFGAAQAPFALLPGAPKSFAFDVSSSLSGTFTIHVDARNAAGATLGSGDGMVGLSPGRRADVAVALSPAGTTTTPGGSAVDVVWIGSGGAAPLTNQLQLNLSAGGFDSVGSSAAPSGASWTSGSFASQTN